MPGSELKTLILRFRDLVTEPGGTIEQHRAKIRDHHSVWWGWWNKPGETVPDDAFRTLRAAAISGEGLRMFLLDSGGGHLFEATCKDIQWNIGHEKAATPDAELTPDYYKGQGYLAWFKFDSISPDPLDPSILRQFSYVAIPEFFVSGSSDFERFYGKQVSSIEEMIQQNRSVWFVRDFEPADPVHEVRLRDVYGVSPADFPQDYLLSQSVNLLWTSDLHFSEGDHHEFPLEPDAARRPLWASIERSLKAHGVSDLAGVIVSGDLAWKALPSEFRMAESFLEEARAGAKLKNYDVLMCPGNHDIAFSPNPADKDQRLGEVTGEAAALARSEYEELYRRLFFKKPNRFLSCGRKFLLGGAVPIEVVSLNSSLLDQTSGLFQGHGFVGDDQLNDAALQMGWDARRNGPRAVRIVVLHHHLLPVTFRDIPYQGANYSVTLDAEAVTRWLLEHKVDLVLHGHMHQPFCARVVRPVSMSAALNDWSAITVVGMGSSGVSQDHLGEVGKNLFCVLTFGSRRVDFRFFSVHSVNPSEELTSYNFSVELDR